jgi:hypothetical protein
MRMTQEDRYNLLKDKLHKNLTPRECYYKENTKGQKIRFWKCECKCGKFVERAEYTILRGLTESCGCKHPRYTNKGKTHPLWTGCEELNGQYISVLKNKARFRNLEWSDEVTPEYLWNLYVSQNKRCNLTGLEINFETYRNKQKGLDQSASLDRINSDIGYVPGNLQWLHKDVNRMKNDLGQERFLELCKLIVTKSQGNLFQNFP